MDRNSIYYQQVRLLIRILPIVNKEACFALKGGTAINLFVRDLPRLSVDIDLVYLPLDDREEALQNIKSALSRIARDIEQEIPGSDVIPAHEKTDALRLFITQGAARIKIELSPVLRGSVFSPLVMDVKPSVEQEFGFAEMRVLALQDLYAGKLCAALDRQHPRDLFDVKLLFENEGISAKLRKTFLVYLISHNRPIVELIKPTRKSLHDIFEGEFENMTLLPVTLKELEDTREKLIKTIGADLTLKEKQFLLSFKARKPNWELLGLKGVDQLPAIKWKMLNLQKMPAEKHDQALKALEEALSFEAKS